MLATKEHQIDVLPTPPSPAIVVIPYFGMYPGTSHSGLYYYATGLSDLRSLLELPGLPLS